MSNQEKELIKRIQGWQANCPAALLLSQIAEETRSPVYYFGGVCRACWKKETPRDIDLVIDDLAWPKFEKAVRQAVMEEKSEPPKTNRFGGLKFKLQGKEVDAWAMEKTWAFATGLSYPACVTTLPETTFLNIESVAALVWHPEEPWVFQKGFFQAMESGIIEIQNPDNPHPALCIARIRKFTNQGWTAGESVLAFEKHHLENGVDETQIEKAGRHHYSGENPENP